jgi:serine/threonine protein kinase/Tfp pilus assembly protein PilF
MNPPEPSLKDIFNQALDHPLGPERLAFLDRACEGDPAFRLQVESLLKAHDEAGGFLGSADPGATASLAKPSILEGPGTTIGPYKLLQQIGEGGMGVVFMAEQEKPVRRKVALKVIKPGMDTAQVIARFEAERQALAMMDHPNIARVLDVGATDTGRPFFVMELVKGVPITEYCDRNHLTPKERLELFIPVCRAIQSAHQKGIIHRDIKPSNILVTLHDGHPVPKVIDFGVAKAIDQRLTERTMFTEFGAIIGTLEYMSPEQAEMGALDIDTRSDIYSLGVLLYELLTGSTPLERAKLRKAAFSEVLRRIREEEPTKPSTRLSESKDALPSISAQRKMEPARLTKLVRGDLDWIVMKSLEKDRTRRYETATGFAKDIQRYLDGDAVEACPPSATYKLKKFARKHRTALATAGAFALLLIAATAVSLGLAYWANRERVRAVAAEKLASEQKKRAQEREQMAIDAVKRFGEVISETPELKNDPALAPLRTRLLKEPHAFFKALRDRLQADQDTSRESLDRLAHALNSLGEITSEIGDKQEALRAYEEFLAIHERLARENPSVRDFQVGLATSHNKIGVLQSDTGRPADALAHHEQALAIRDRLARENPAVTQFRTDLAASHNNIGALLSETGRTADALAHYEQAIAIQDRLARENPAVTEFRTDLAASHNNIGVLQSKTGRAADALDHYQQALAIRDRLARENPSVTQFRTDLARSHHNIGILLSDTGRPADALAHHEQALAIRERLARENPSVTKFRSDLAASHNDIGVLLSDTGRPAAALAHYEQALAIRERLARENPSVTQFRTDLAASHNNIGILQSDTGRPADALAHYEQALAIRDRLAREHPESPDLASSLGGTLNNMAVIDLDKRRFDEARVKLKQAIEWQRKALASNPNHPTYRQFLSNHLNNLVRATEGLGLADEADAARRELAELAASDPVKLALDARLAAVLKGQPAKDNAERLPLAVLAYEKALHATSARLFGEALANDPRLINDRKAQHAYNAACAAALAGCGQGKDDPPPDDATRVKLRGQALDWLKAELAEWAKVLDAGPPEMKAKVAPALQHWKVDADLLGIRDEKELAKLPEAERGAFQQLWLDVDRLLARASGKM